MSIERTNRHATQTTQAARLSALATSAVFVAQQSAIGTERATPCGVIQREITMANRDVNPSQGFGATDRQLDWELEENYWRDNWSARPYASADRGFEYYRPAYRYGAENATRLNGRKWNDVESDLRSGWDRYENRGQSTWENVKDAVRDAWDRVTNR